MLALGTSVSTVFSLVRPGSWLDLLGGSVVQRSIRGQTPPAGSGYSLFSQGSVLVWSLNTPSHGLSTAFTETLCLQSIVVLSADISLCEFIPVFLDTFCGTKSSLNF